MKEFETIQLKKGVRLSLTLTDKFKTNYIGFTFHRPLSTKEVTVNSLLSAVITRGCKSYPETAELSKKFQELYGASLGVSARKNGESQLIHFGFEFASDKFIPSGEGLFESIAELAKELVFDHNKFNETYVEQEKENTRTLILSIFNDKRSYAQIRMIEEMCKGEAYGILDVGRIEDLPSINGDVLYNHYRDVVLTSPLDIFFMGNADKDKVIDIANELAQYVNVTEEYPGIEVKKTVEQVKTVVQQESIAQAKLSMGFRTKSSKQDGDHFALTVYNTILGGGPYSRLFNNVREKMSLCYHISSALDKNKGIMCINAGIECDKFEVTRDAILEQEKIVRTGAFTDEELASAKLCLIDSFRGTSDSQRRMENFCLAQLTSGEEEGLAEYIECIGSVTRDRVIQAAKDVELDTVYLLTKKD
ncbi:MAG: pitrilysin family protein [Eubacteriales bacterium]|nr:pitrilysin family protein [Eubacteriales bacterium]